MTSYKELLKQREALEQQIAEARQRELKDAIQQVRSVVSEYGLTIQDVFPSKRDWGRVMTPLTAPAAPKFRNPDTGETWTGRGKPPKWIEGKDRTPFLIG